jgi:hypothetical protein
VSSFRKLDPAEIQTPVIRPLSKRARVAQEYDALLEGFIAGDHGRAELLDGEQRMPCASACRPRRAGATLRCVSGPAAAH